MIATIRSLKASLECVKISAINDGVYHATLVLKDADNNRVEVDTRTSDAIALAIREKCPILYS
jgi:bifunctional DNase/RNase